MKFFLFSSFNDRRDLRNSLHKKVIMECLLLEYLKTEDGGYKLRRNALVKISLFGHNGRKMITLKNYKLLNKVENLQKIQ
jgi:hypothetical protein